MKGGAHWFYSIRDAVKKNGKKSDIVTFAFDPSPPSLRVTSLKGAKVVFRRPPPLRKSDKSCDFRWISGEYTKKEIKLEPSIFS